MKLSSGMTKIISLLIYACIKFLNLTYRYRYAGNENLKKLDDKKQNFIFAIWHQNLFSGILAQNGLPHIVIVSQSKDADPVAFACKHLGHFVVRGSSKKNGVDKGGALAKEEMIEYLNLGHPGAITVDGPKGPALKVKPGIIDMAKKSNAQLIPYTVCSNSFWQFKSWDKFRLPKPFAKLLIAYGEPITIPDSCIEFACHQEALEKSLNELTLYSEKCLLKWNQFSKKNWFE
jgi:lysophospholipid acyltransferase (LPLAT)-like uncharacterized protein